MHVSLAGQDTLANEAYLKQKLLTAAGEVEEATDVLTPHSWQSERQRQRNARAVRAGWWTFENVTLLNQRRRKAAAVQVPIENLLELKRHNSNPSPWFGDQRNSSSSGGWNGCTPCLGKDWEEENETRTAVPASTSHL